jgi:hypothetical protein
MPSIHRLIASKVSSIMAVGAGVASQCANNVRHSVHVRGVLCKADFLVYACALRPCIVTPAYHVALYSV